MPVRFGIVLGLRILVAAIVLSPLTVSPRARAAPEVDSDARDFWSFRPIARPTVPAVKAQDWVHTSIDAFVLSKLETVGLTPAPPASRTALLRRVYYDLIGLPPTPNEVSAFLEDNSPEAYE